MRWQLIYTFWPIRIQNWSFKPDDLEGDDCFLSINHFLPNFSYINISKQTSDHLQKLWRGVLFIAVYFFLLKLRFGRKLDF